MCRYCEYKPENLKLYDNHDRVYNSWDDDLCDGSFSPDFKDRATGFKFCHMCGRKLVKNKK